MFFIREEQEIYLNKKLSSKLMKYTLTLCLINPCPNICYRSTWCDIEIKAMLQKEEDGKAGGKQCRCYLGRYTPSLIHKYIYPIQHPQYMAKV